MVRQGGADSPDKIPLNQENNTLTYTGLSGDRFKLFTDQIKPPRINDNPIDYAPARAYDSPFVQGDLDSGLVMIRKGDRKLVLNFNE